MTLGLWDYSAWRWVGSTDFNSSQVDSTYTWVKAATSITPSPGDRVVFIAEFANHTTALSTDWYIDEAVVVPSGGPAPAA